MVLGKISKMVNLIPKMLAPMMTIKPFYWMVISPQGAQNNDGILPVKSELSCDATRAFRSFSHTPYVKRHWVFICKIVLFLKNCECKNSRKQSNVTSMIFNKFVML